MFVVLLLGTAFLQTVGCSSVLKKAIQEPKVKVSAFELSDVGIDGATANIVLEIENPNSFAIPIDRVDYKIEMDGKPVAEASLLEPAKLESQKVTSVRVPVPFQFNRVFESLLQVLAKGSAHYRATGFAQISLLKIPFDHEGEVEIK